MKPHVSPLRMLSLLLVAVAFSGCASSPPSRFYRLTPQLQEGGEVSRQARSQLSVSISPVVVPDYLDRPQIVTLDGQNVIKLAEFDRWAGSLPDNIALVLAENLSQQLGSDRVYVSPRSSPAKPDYSVSLRVLSLDCVPGRDAILKAQWTIISAQDAKDLVMHTATYRETLIDARYDTLAAAVSRMAAQLGGDIARDIAPSKQLK